jgi:hypothetical protein
MAEAVNRSNTNDNHRDLAGRQRSEEYDVNIRLESVFSIISK